MVWVLIGPRKKNRPGVQAFDGTMIVIRTLCPGVRTPLEGLKIIPPGTLVNAFQFNTLWLPGPDSTLAKQVKLAVFLQSRCPTILIDAGWRSSTAGAAGATGGCFTGGGAAG